MLMKKSWERGEWTGGNFSSNLLCLLHVHFFHFVIQKLQFALRRRVNLTKWVGGGVWRGWRLGILSGLVLGFCGVLLEKMGWGILSQARG